MTKGLGFLHTIVPSIRSLEIHSLCLSGSWFDRCPGSPSLSGEFITQSDLTAGFSFPVPSSRISVYSAVFLGSDWRPLSDEHGHDRLSSTS